MAWMSAASQTIWYVHCASRERFSASLVLTLQCYANCGEAVYSECESAFKKCLAAACKRRYPTATTEGGKQCRSTAALFHTATSIGGCQYYQESQRDACDCSDHGGDGILPSEQRRAKRSRQGGRKGRSMGGGKGRLEL
jgi:hypothetical protein